MVRAMNSSGPGPSRLWVGGGIIVTGLALGAAWLLLGYRSLTSEVEEFQRVPVDGGGQVTFRKPGNYTVYYEAAA